MHVQKRAAFATLRDLQGRSASPIVVLLAMYINKAPVNKRYLATILGSSPNTISRIVDRLEMDGYIQRDGYRRWILPNGQLPLPGFELSSTPRISASTPRIPPKTPSSIPSDHPDDVHADRSEIRADDAPIRVLDAPVHVEADLDPETSTVDVSPLLTTTTDTSVQDKPVVVSSSKSRETSNCDVSAELAAAFTDCGIGRGAWDRLAALEWVTPAYVRALWARLQADPNPRRRTVALLIHCMRSGDPAPELCDRCGGLDGQHASDCRQRYSGGKHAHLFER